MIKLNIEKKPTPKFNTVSIRLSSEVYRTIKSHVPKDKSSAKRVTMHQILVSIIEQAVAEGIKINYTEPKNEPKRRDDGVD